MTTKNFATEIAELAAAAPLVMQANAELLEAKREKRDIDVAIVESAVLAVQPALPVLVGRIETSRTQARKKGAHGTPVDVGGVLVNYASVRGLALATSSTWGTVDDPSTRTQFYLMEDGAFARVLRTPYGDNVQQFKANWTPRGTYRVGYAQLISNCTTHELLDHVTVDEVIHALREAMRRQQESRVRAQADIKESMNTIQAQAAGKSPYNMMPPGSGK